MENGWFFSGNDARWYTCTCTINNIHDLWWSAFPLKIWTLMFKPYNVNTNVIDFYFKDCDLYELRTGWNGFLQQPHISYSLFILNLYHLIHGRFTSNIDRDCRRSGKYKETTIRRRVRIVLNCYIQLYLFSYLSEKIICYFHIRNATHSSHIMATM